MCQYKLGPFARVVGWVNLAMVAFCYLEWYRWQQQQEATGKDKPFWQRLRTAGLKEKVRQQVQRAELEAYSSALLPPMTGSSVSGACWIKWAAPLPLPQLEMDLPLPQLGATLPLPQPDGKIYPYFRSVLRAVSKRASEVMAATVPLLARQACVRFFVAGVITGSCSESSIS